MLPHGKVVECTEGPPTAARIGSWPMVGSAGDATALLGLLILAATANVATVRLRARRTRQ